MRFGSTALATERVERKLAAIAANVAGYGRLMSEDEDGTLARLKAHRRKLIDPKIAEHRGRVAVRPRYRPRPACHQVQAGMTERGAETAEDKQMAFRIGVRLDDEIADGDDMFGDGLNVAPWLEPLAERAEAHGTEHACIMESSGRLIDEKKPVELCVRRSGAG